MKLQIDQKIQKQKGWQFYLSVKEKQFVIDVDKQTVQQVGANSAEQLLEASFLFLLDQEPLANILSEFNLEDIKKYYPNYTNAIRKYL